ncbi:growth/differentiation factor 10 [Clupea harengus]|uniref:Growth/differentiation factor 10 n=1 Tax=Clupea harengus TaxID=7950 RepID=A0A8M1KVA2_CLUHA|nr:growth/differentiation factor 10 [Clupea harengus]
MVCWLVCLMLQLLCFVTTWSGGFAHESAAPWWNGDSGRADALERHMIKIYEKYSRELRQSSDANTVRSFRAIPVNEQQVVHFLFNLSTLQRSEVILSASLHFLLDPQPHPQPRPRLRSAPPPAIHLLFQDESPGATPDQGRVLGNLTSMPPQRGVWQIEEVGGVIRQAGKAGLISLQVVGVRGQHMPRLFLVVFANDHALSQPNSVAASLQRYDHAPSDPPASRRPRRHLQAPPSDPLTSNQLPHDSHTHTHTHIHHHRHSNTGQLTHTGSGRSDAAREVEEEEEESPLLRFDERTLRQARRQQQQKQQQPISCERKQLRVDFADVGWSEWVLLPKAYDAYYCTGACRFPLAKALRPSNHATLQSIVSAVGIVTGVPPPCCVPAALSPLPVLYRDAGHQLVLKLYPNMTVDTCSCR